MAGQQQSIDPLLDTIKNVKGHDQRNFKSEKLGAVGIDGHGFRCDRAGGKH